MANTVGDALRKLHDKELAKARLIERKNDAKGRLGEYLSERWLREDRGMEVVSWDQTCGTRNETAPPGGKRPDFVTEVVEAIFADAKIRSDGTVLAISDVEIAQYRATMAHYDVAHLVFLMIPLSDPLRLVTVHIDNLVTPASVGGRPGHSVAIHPEFDPYTYLIPEAWWDDGIAMLRDTGFEQGELPVRT